MTVVVISVMQLRVPMLCVVVGVVMLNAVILNYYNECQLIIVFMQGSDMLSVYIQIVIVVSVVLSFMLRNMLSIIMLTAPGCSS